MQTFLPLPDFEESARVLDRQRLGKQRLENLQLIQAILCREVVNHEQSVEYWQINHRSFSRANHPAAKMWDRHAGALLAYQTAVCKEWANRGYRDTLLARSVFVVTDALGERFQEYDLPWWFGDEAFHAAHRSNLLRKDPEYYGQFGWTEPDDLEYVWPKAEQW